MKNKSTATKFLEYIERNPKLRYKQMQQFFWRNKYPNKPLADMSRGYYCTNIQTLIYKGHISKDQNKLYSLTKSGKQYQKTPYAETKEAKIANEAIEDYKRRMQDWHNWYLQRADARGHIETIGELKALLNEFDNHYKIEVAIDPEINAVGPIATQVCEDQDGFRRLITLFPTHTRPV